MHSNPSGPTKQSVIERFWLLGIGVGTWGAQLEDTFPPKIISMMKVPLLKVIETWYLYPRMSIDKYSGPWFIRPHLFLIKHVG